MEPEADYYAVLGVPRDAPAGQIRKAFRERARACHPDRVANLDDDLRGLAEEKMVELNEAYAVLRNPDRRAAYDDHAARARRSRTNRTAPMPRTATPHRRPGRTRSAGAVPPPRWRPRGPLIDPLEARHRIGEQQFVARAAAEEFQAAVRRCMPGARWTNIAFPGSTTALRARSGRRALNFVLLAGPLIDDSTLRCFLGALKATAPRLERRITRCDHLFGFAGALEFVHHERLKATLERFNERLGTGAAIRPATLVDLVSWQVVPGEISLRERLENLTRGM